MYNNNPRNHRTGNRANSNMRTGKIIKQRKNFNIRTVLSASLCLVILISVSGIFSYATKLYTDKPNEPKAHAANTLENESEAVKTEPVSSYALSSNDWKLTLVNNANPLSSSHTVTTVALGNGQVVDTRIYKPLMDMLKAGEREGLSFVVCSGYRPYKEQEVLFNQQIAAVQAEGNTYEKAYEIAKTSVAEPGTSEHQLGLAVDIVSSSYQLLDDKQAETSEAQWLEANCYKYGFILRYPVAKTSITGIIYEPWHYRYVGVEVATEIMKSGLTLEEYFEN